MFYAILLFNIIASFLVGYVFKEYYAQHRARMPIGSKPLVIALVIISWLIALANAIYLSNLAFNLITT